MVQIAKSITQYQPEDDSMEYKLTDVGECRALCGHVQDDVKYCSIYKKWFVGMASSGNRMTEQSSVRDSVHQEHVLVC